MGYTPVFDTMLTGTLYGRWPHTGIWACLLSRASREGLIDETPQSLAAAIGVPLETLLDCIRDFCAPDPDSRTAEFEGRRLALIHEHRTWGWRVLNHGKYREKARKKAYDDDRTTSGKDAGRKRQERASRDVPTRPAMSRDVPLSYADAYAEAEAEKIKTRARDPVPREAQPPDLEPAPHSPPIDPTAERAVFEACRAGYPESLTRGDQWLIAEREVYARLAEGVPGQRLIEATADFARQQAALGNLGTGEILRASKFYAGNPGPWCGPFPMPKARAARKDPDPVRTWRPPDDEEDEHASQRA